MDASAEIEIFDSFFFDSFCDPRINMGQFREFVKSEAPDFRSGDGKVGIELVAYYRDASTAGKNGSRRRRWEQHLQELVDRAKAKYAKSSSGPAEVYLFPRRPTVAKLAVPLGAETLLAEAVAARADGGPDRIPPSLATIVEALKVVPTHLCHDEAHWEVAIADRTDVSPQAVQAILRQKETLVCEYRKPVQEILLLVHGSRMPYVGGTPDSGRWSSCGHVTQGLRTFQFQSSFDRVYYFDRDQKQHIPLRVQGNP